MVGKKPDWRHDVHLHCPLVRGGNVKRLVLHYTTTGGRFEATSERFTNLEPAIGSEEARGRDNKPIVHTGKSQV